MPQPAYGPHDLVIGEGSMYDRLRRGAADLFDPDIAHAGMIYDPRGRETLEATHREYIDVAQRHGFPIVAGAPTWRASADRIARSAHAGRDVNGDAVRLMKELRESYGPGAAPILISGNHGPAGDAYRPGEAPDEEGARAFHAPQIEALAAAGIDLLRALTLPALPEAKAIARIQAETGLPNVISFVIRRGGALLDGTPLADAIAEIDDAAPPSAYAVNCVHATVFAEAMETIGDAAIRARITGIDANTSARSPEELDGLDEIDTEAPADFGPGLAALRSRYGLTYLGGCCGSSTAHIAALAEALG